ncbi:MAG: D-2-hydroxyacid dehydrogenase [Tissierellia bacterium]|nr:D-2-hydroxyacid dehydrogenase [Tissierellia bacterium]
MNRVLIADGMDKEKAEELRKLGYDLIEKKVDKDELLDIVKDIDAIVVRSRTKVTREVVDAALETGNLKIVIRAGIGLDNIDLDYCKEKGIKVFNTPNSSANSVAELAIGQMISIARFADLANIEMKEEKWNKADYKGFEIMDKTLGLIGFGRISKTLADKASALGMNIIYTDLIDQDYENYRQVDMDELLSESDFISIHIPGGPANKHMISDSEFAKMKDGVFLINLSRGGIVDEKALIKALDNGKLRAAAVDVFEEEPTGNKELLKHNRVALTPHIGASTIEAQKRIACEVINILEENLNGQD